MTKQRTVRLNSLLKEVISDVIRTHVKNPSVSGLITVTRVDITKDLHYAKVYISVIGDETQKLETMKALRSAAGFIAVTASKMVVMRYFPELTFVLDDSVDKQMRIETLLKEIRDEQGSRPPSEEESDSDEASDNEEADDQEESEKE